MSIKASAIWKQENW